MVQTVRMASCLVWCGWQNNLLKLLEAGTSEAYFKFWYCPGNNSNTTPLTNRFSAKSNF